MIEDLIVEYARIYSNAVDKEHELAKANRDVIEHEGILSELDVPNAAPINISDHGFAQISTRFESAIAKSPIAYNYVYKAKEGESLISPSNLKAFILTIMSKAFYDGDYKKETDRGRAIQYRYTIKLYKMSDEEKSLSFVGIIKNSTIVTGFFNWEPI
jgi:hypothetical protein